MRVFFSQSLATECAISEFCQSQRWETGSLPGFRISVTSVIMRDNHSFSCDGSNYSRINVQGPGGATWVCVLSHVQLFVTPWTVACQVPLSMGIFRARIPEWVAIPSSKGSSWPRDRTRVSGVSCFGRRMLCHRGGPGVGVAVLPSSSTGPSWSKLALSFSAFLGS